MIIASLPILAAYRKESRLQIEKTSEAELHF